MTDPQIQSIHLEGIASMNPVEFNPNIGEYQIERSSDSPCQISFSVLLNGRPDYNRLQLVYSFTGNEYRDCSLNITENADLYQRNDPSIRNYVTIPNLSNATLSVSMGPQKRFREKIPWVTYTFHLKNYELNEEQKRNCTHQMTYTSEGEVWGGASGSCQVEMLRSCSLCLSVVDRWYDHRD